MTDDIYDYFGGNSAREVEPFEEDDLSDAPSDSLKDASESFETEGAAFLAEESEEYRAVAESLEDAPEPVPADTLSGEPEEQPQTADMSHWDQLASSLGVAPQPVPAKPEKAVDPKPTKAAVKKKSNDRKSSRSKRDKDSGLDSPKPTESSFGFGIFPSDAEPSESAEQSRSEEPPMEQESSNPDVLSEMFVPRDEDFDAPVQADVASESGDDRIDESGSEPSDVEAGYDQEEEVEGDFIQFEIEDLDSTPVDESSRRPPRRRRRDRQEPASEPDAHVYDESSDKAERRPGRSKARRRRRTASADDATEIRGEDHRQREYAEDKTTDSRRSATRKKDRQSEKSEKKRPKIPTWDEAINGMIDSNIQSRRTANSGSRGRRRRR